VKCQKRKKRDSDKFFDRKEGNQDLMLALSNLKIGVELSRMR